MGRGRFITFEGGEGAGKSTQARRLAEQLEAAGHAVVVTREPGGTPFAEQLRGILLLEGGEERSPNAEALAFYAARLDHLDRLIRPALARGEWVVCDRFSDSTRVYQGVAGRVAGEFIDALERVVVGETKPDMTIVLDLPAEVGLARAAARRVSEGQIRPDRYEERGLAYHSKLREGFLAIAAREPERCLVIDGGLEIEVIRAAIWRAVAARLTREA
ncbi:MAG: hypothetical protein RLZ98_1399 [Pseudomonadota bacterium]|jgi:dTMP kinase